jgi:predicted nucleic acid-binding protein
MEKKILIDSNLVIDLLLDRCSPIVNETNDLFNILMQGVIKGYITDIGLAKISLVTDIACQYKPQKVRDIKSDIKNLFKVCEVRRDIIDRVKKSKLSNIDSAIYLECSSTYNLDAIVTSDPNNFQSNSLNEKESYVFTPCGYINHYYESNLKGLVYELGQCKLQQGKNVIFSEKAIQTKHNSSELTQAKRRIEKSKLTFSSLV